MWKYLVWYVTCSPNISIVSSTASSQRSSINLTSQLTPITSQPYSQLSPLLCPLHYGSRNIIEQQNVINPFVEVVFVSVWVKNLELWPKNSWLQKHPVFVCPREGWRRNINYSFYGMLAVCVSCVCCWSLLMRAVYRQLHRQKHQHHDQSDDGGKRLNQQRYWKFMEAYCGLCTEQHHSGEFSWHRKGEDCWAILYKGCVLWF